MTFLLNPYAFGPGAGGGGAGYYTSETLGAQAAAASLTDIHSTTETLSAGDWVGFWNFEAQNAGSTQTHTGRVVVDGVAGATQVWLTKESTTPPDKANFGGTFFFTSSGAATTFAIQAAKSISGTTTCSNARLSLLKLGADDETAISTAAQSFVDPANKTAQTAATLAFTPPSAGDYLVICTALVTLGNGSNVQMTIELTDGTTSTGAIEIRPAGASGEKYPITLLLPLSAISGSKTISFKVRQSGSGVTTIGTEDIRILALRLDRFANAYSQKLASVSSGTQTTYTTALSLSPTVAAGPHLALASGFYCNGTGSVSAYSEFNDGGVQVQEAIRENFVFVIRYEQMMSHRISDYAAGSRTLSINRKAEANTAYVAAGSCIAVIDLTGI